MKYRICNENIYQIGHYGEYQITTLILKLDIKISLISLELLQILKYL